jgi:FlaA1/EpsC-like NDP-sugar epimerase
MTIPEACQLVLEAGAFGEGGEIFLFDMGKSVKIVDLVRKMIKLYGLTVGKDIEIVYTGLRPGEKLYEELLIGDNPTPTQHLQIMKANEEFLAWSILQQKLEALNWALNRNDVLTIRSLLQELVPGYVASDEVVDWVYLASKSDVEHH